ncbi:MAG: hypothetical protein IJB45_04255 [Clostridia bacterium]|nr:hypothetical protein [Clostridia bacterium]
MVKANFFNSEDGRAVCFELEFFMGEYIPEKYFRICGGLGTQALFLEELLKNSGLLRSKESKAPFRDFYWNCSVEGIGFVMHHDAVWDTVDFIVSDEKYTGIVAMKLSRLIEARRREAEIKVS